MAEIFAEEGFVWWELLELPEFSSRLLVFFPVLWEFSFARSWIGIGARILSELVPMDSGGVPPLPLPVDLEAFKRLIASCDKRNGGRHLISLSRRLTFHRLNFQLNGLTDRH